MTPSPLVRLMVSPEVMRQFCRHPAHGRQAVDASLESTGTGTVREVGNWVGLVVPNPRQPRSAHSSSQPLGLSPGTADCLGLEEESKGTGSSKRCVCLVTGHDCQY